jgi:hypothetical protein
VPSVTLHNAVTWKEILHGDNKHCLYRSKVTSAETKYVLRFYGKKALTWNVQFSILYIVQNEQPMFFTTKFIVSLKRNETYCVQIRLWPSVDSHGSMKRHTWNPRHIFSHNNNNNNIETLSMLRLEVLAAIIITLLSKSWVLAPCGFAGRCRRFGEHAVSFFTGWSDNAGK